MIVGTTQRAKNLRTGWLLIGMFAVMFIGSVIYVAIYH